MILFTLGIVAGLFAGTAFVLFALSYVVLSLGNKL